MNLLNKYSKSKILLGDFTKVNNKNKWLSTWWLLLLVSLLPQISRSQQLGLSFQWPPPSCRTNPDNNNHSNFCPPYICFFEKRSSIMQWLMALESGNHELWTLKFSRPLLILSVLQWKVLIVLSQRLIKRIKWDKVWEGPGKWSSFMNGSWKYTASLVNFLLISLFSLPWRHTGKEVLEQGMMALAFSDASSPSPCYHLFYNLHVQALPLSQPYLLPLFYPTINFSPTVQPNTSRIFKLYARCFPCLEGSSQPYSTKVLPIL